MKTKIILIHGNGGGTMGDHWYPYIKENLEKTGVEVIARDFPDAQLARASFWLPFLKELEAGENTILIGHSSGAVAAMRFAEQNTILGSILVGACYTDLGDDTERASGYYDHPWNWEKIKQNQQWIVQFASTDDPYIPIAEAQYIHEHLNTEYYEYTDQGHFGTDSLNRPKKEFPEIVAIVEKKLRL